jgi:hypothetical protein
LLVAEVEEIMTVAESDNCTAWDLRSNGSYVRRRPAKGEEPRPSQQVFMNIVR